MIILVRVYVWMDVKPHGKHKCHGYLKVEWNTPIYMHCFVQDKDTSNWESS
jgi:hypothetical protein